MGKLTKTWIRDSIGAALITLISALIVFAVIGIAPFGDRSLTYSDGQFQMIDLFTWYKDVLTGKASIDYSFGKSLGGSNFAVFTYYLASPTSLLVLFFDKTKIPLFINLIYLIKAVLAAAFASYYLTRRFAPDGKYLRCAAVMLAVSYALSPFFIAQSSNTMWLDGAYMLPLILAGTEKIVEGRRSILFTISAALAILFNWYSGIIDLLFACFWFLYELARVHLASKTTIKTKLTSVIRFGISCCISVLMSCALLLPTLMMLSGRTHGKRGLSMLADISMIGPVSGFFYNYSFGMISVRGSVSLFAGSFVLLGVVLYFICSKDGRSLKFLNLGLSLFAVLMYFWQPLVALFSMLREVESYWYRYTYLGCFALIVLAAGFYLNPARKALKPRYPAAVAGGFIAVLAAITFATDTPVADYCLISMINGIALTSFGYDTAPLVLKIIFPALTACLLALLMSKKGRSGSMRDIISYGLAAVIAIELIAGTSVLGRFYSVENVPHIEDYVANDIALIPAANDANEAQLIRTLQTTAHSNHANSFPLSYNEGMAYGFNSVTSFVSDPEEDVVYFLDRAGYAAHSETITCTSQENLALDSLLNVRYVLTDAADTNTAGLIFANEIEGFKTLYTNPYAVPAAFVYEGTGDYDSDAEVPALYINDIYRELTGSDEDIFTQVPFSSDRNGCTWNYTAPAVEGILYANFVTNTDEGAMLSVNHDEYTRYSDFLAPSQIRVPVDDHEANISIEFDGDNTEAEVIRADFYELDIDALERATDTLKSRVCTASFIADGEAWFETEGREGQSLFISIPYDEGWTVTRNGEVITPDIFGGAFMSIPLADGSNRIEMNYKVSHKGTGAAVSIIGVLLFIGCAVFEDRKLKR